jgi:hypothetical protein
VSAIAVLNNIATVASIRDLSFRLAPAGVCF